jgi:hypothetical protein
MIFVDRKTTIFDKSLTRVEPQVPQGPLTSRRQLSGPSLKAIKRLYEEGFTEVFTYGFTKEDLGFPECRWTKLGEYPRQFPKDVVAYLRNPRILREYQDLGEQGRFVSTNGDVKNVRHLHRLTLRVEAASFPVHDPLDDATAGTSMDEDDIVDDRVITRGDVRYYPLSLAAELAQAPPQTLLSWIKSKTKFHGDTLDSYDSPTAGKLYLSEESVDRVANRFVSWPSNLGSGLPHLGKTDDRSGYIRISSAAKILGVSSRTMWLWADQGTALSDIPLDIIKCTTSNYFYIREKDVYALKAFVPRSGLRRGRPRQSAPQP